MAVFAQDFAGNIGTINNFDKVQAYLSRLNDQLRYMFDNLTPEDNYAAAAKLEYETYRHSEGSGGSADPSEIEAMVALAQEAAQQAASSASMAASAANSASSSAASATNSATSAAGSATAASGSASAALSSATDASNSAASASSSATAAAGSATTASNSASAAAGSATAAAGSATSAAGSATSAAGSASDAADSASDAATSASEAEAAAGTVAEVIEVTFTLAGWTQSGTGYTQTVSNADLKNKDYLLLCSVENTNLSDFEILCGGTMTVTAGAVTAVVSDRPSASISVGLKQI